MSYYDLGPLVTLRGQIELAADSRIHRQKELKGFTGDRNMVKDEWTFLI